MISKALNFLLIQLRDYIRSTDTIGATLDAPDYVVLGNIALADMQDLTPTIRQRTVLSLVNVDEETVYKNQPHIKKRGTESRYVNPPIYLNLFLLFSANYDDYDNALIRLSQVIEFFQGNKVFTFNTSPLPGFLGDEDMTEMKLIMDLHTLTFEQINYLWGSLGGKQVPFAMYKMRLIKIDADRTKETGKLIEEIHSTEVIS